MIRIGRLKVGASALMGDGFLCCRSVAVLVNFHSRLKKGYWRTRKLYQRLSGDGTIPGPPVEILGTSTKSEPFI